MRFSIRDLLWATLVVAMGLGWWMSYRASAAKQLEAVQQTQHHRATLTAAKNWINGIREIYQQRTSSRLIYESTELNWSVADEPLVEP